MNFPEAFYRWRPHPWHGLEPGPQPPSVVHAYIEITPFDRVKYEVDKVTGYMRVDRPQRTSSQPPTLYGFIPRTVCRDRVAALMPEVDRGDRDPLDICVISERPINRGEVIVDARVIGGLQMIDHDEADDKIIGVLASDDVFSTVNDVADLPSVLVERIRHYFGTYKMGSADEPNSVRLLDTYSREHAYRVIEAALGDYAEEYGRG